MLELRFRWQVQRTFYGFSYMRSDRWNSNATRTTIDDHLYSRPIRRPRRPLEFRDLRAVHRQSMG